MILHHSPATEELRPRHRAGYYQRGGERGSVFHWCFFAACKTSPTSNTKLIFFVQSHLRWIRISWNPIFQSRTLSGREINPLTSDSAGGEGATKGGGERSIPSTHGRWGAHPANCSRPGTPGTPASSVWGRWRGRQTSSRPTCAVRRGGGAL